MVEVLDDYYLLFVNKFDDVIVLIMKALVLGLGCSFEIEKHMSQQVVSFDPTSYLFKHFMLIMCKLFGSTFHVTMPDGSRSIFSMANEQPKVKIGSPDPILVLVSHDGMLSLMYPAQFFANKGLDIEKTSANPEYKVKSMFTPRQSYVPIREEQQPLAKDTDIKHKDHYVTSKLEDDYLSNDNIYNPMMAYKTEIDSKRASMFGRPEGAADSMQPGNNPHLSNYKDMQAATLINLSTYYSNHDDIFSGFVGVTQDQSERQKLLTFAGSPLVPRTLDASTPRLIDSIVADQETGIRPPGSMGSKKVEANFSESGYFEEQLHNGEGSILYSHDLRQSIDFCKNTSKQGIVVNDFANCSAFQQQEEKPDRATDLRQFYQTGDSEPDIPTDYLTLGPSDLAIYSHSNVQNSNAGVPSTELTFTDSKRQAMSLVDKIKLIISESQTGEHQTDGLGEEEEEGFEMKLPDVLDVSIPMVHTISKEQDQEPSDGRLKTIEESLNEDASLIGLGEGRNKIQFTTVQVQPKQTATFIPQQQPPNLPYPADSFPNTYVTNVQPSIYNLEASQPTIQPLKPPGPVGQLSAPTPVGVIANRLNTGGYVPKSDPTLSDKAKDPRYNKRPTASVELLNRINQTWIENHQVRPEMDFGPLEDRNNETRLLDPSAVDLRSDSQQLGFQQSQFTDQPSDRSPKKADLQPTVSLQTSDQDILTRKNQLLKRNDTDKPCRICSKPHRMTKMYYYDRAFFCADCYVVLAQRFKKINRCASCKSEPERVLILKFIMANPFVKSQGSLLFTREKKVDLFYTHMNKYSTIIHKDNDLLRTLQLISNNLVTPVSTFVEIKVCAKCQTLIVKCVICKNLICKQEAFCGDKCNHHYCLDCISIIFLKKYLQKKEFTCKGHFCWTKTLLVKVMQFLMGSLSTLEAECNLNNSRASR